jgi:hypothetical protein
VQIAKQIRRYIQNALSPNYSFNDAYTEGDQWIILDGWVEEVWKRHELTTLLFGGEQEFLEKSTN